MTTTKSTTPKAPKKPKAAAVKKPAVHKAKAEHVVHHKKPATTEAEMPAVAQAAAVTTEKPTIAKGRYIFATGRRKTAVANVRLFSGHGDSVVNKKPLKTYFQYGFYQETIEQPFNLTGLGKDFHFTATINGGGSHAQATALSHGLSIALSKTSEEIRKVLKKNGLLTRDDRKKERKKPGLKRARRSPQWAKR